MSEKGPSRSASPMPAAVLSTESQSINQPKVDQASVDLHSFYDLPPIETPPTQSPDSQSQSIDQSNDQPIESNEITESVAQLTINDKSTNQSNDSEIIKQIMSKFAEFHTDLTMNQSRRLIKEGKIMRQATFKTVERQVYLFNDCFLITEPINNSKQTNNQEKLVQKQLLDLRGVLVEDPESGNQAKSKKCPPNSFVLMTPQRDFVFIAANSSVKQEWIKAIRDASSQHKLTNPDNSLDSMIDGSKVFGADQESISGADDRLLSATLHSATAAGTDDILLHLLSERGEDPNAMNPDGTTALHLAIEHMNAFAVSLLIAHGADLSIKDRQGNTPLHLACAHSDFGTVMVLVSKGADVTLVDGQDKSPLWVLCEHMGKQSSNPSTNHSNSSGKHSTHDCLKACADMVRFMLDAGAKLDDTYQGDRILEHMAHAGHYEAVYSLIVSGASISHADASGRTILHHMCAQESAADSDQCDRHLKIIQLLLASGCPPNVRDAQSNTPLHLTRSLAIAGCLIVNGARPDLKNEQSVKASAYFDSKTNFGNEGEWLAAAEALRDAREGWTNRPETVLEEDADLNDGSMLESINSSIHQCMLCTAAFSTLTRRKHLCERCGTPVCSDCSSKQFTISNDAKKHRSCDVCYNTMCDKAAAEARKRREEKRKQQRLEQAANAKKAVIDDKVEEAARRADFEAREARIAEIEARTHKNKEAFEERKARDRARDNNDKINDLKGSLGSSRAMLDERGQKLNEMGDKSSELADKAERFSELAKKLKEKEKSKSSWFGF